MTLSSHEDELEDDEKRQLLSGLETSATKMNRIVTDLLDMDRIERGIIEPKRESINVGELVERVTAELCSSGERKIIVDVEPVVLDVDAARVERIVENLVLNALRHTDDDTPVWVRVFADDGGGVLAVEDAGPGIPEELRGTIFQPFRRGRGETPYEGSGIGLSLVARFAELHGGQAWVQERPGGGASFRVFLPNTPSSPVP
jgi:signal transduction histidine kinase